MWSIFDRKNVSVKTTESNQDINNNLPINCTAKATSSSSNYLCFIFMCLSHFWLLFNFALFVWIVSSARWWESLWNCSERTIYVQYDILRFSGIMLHKRKSNEEKTECLSYLFLLPLSLCIFFHFLSSILLCATLLWNVSFKNGFNRCLNDWLNFILFCCGPHTSSNWLFSDILQL